MKKKFDKSKLAQVMSDKKLNRHRFSKLCDITPTQLKKYLDGTLKPNMDTFEKMMEATGKSANFFFS